MFYLPGYPQSLKQCLHMKEARPKIVEFIKSSCKPLELQPFSLTEAPAEQESSILFICSLSMVLYEQQETPRSQTHQWKLQHSFNYSDAWSASNKSDIKCDFSERLESWAKLYPILLCKVFFSFPNTQNLCISIWLSTYQHIVVHRSVSLLRTSG